jgi:hypothetical protein
MHLQLAFWFRGVSNGVGGREVLYPHLIFVCKLRICP